MDAEMVVCDDRLLFRVRYADSHLALALHLRYATGLACQEPADARILCALVREADRSAIVERQPLSD